MARAGLERGAAVALRDELLSPPGLEAFYQAGPVTYRSFKFNGGWWIGVFEAEHDGTGWLVTKTTRRPLAILPGDGVHIRAEVVEDHGDVVMVALRSLRGEQQVAVAAGSIVFLEEAPGPVDRRSRSQHA